MDEVKSPTSTLRFQSETSQTFHVIQLLWPSESQYQFTSSATEFGVTKACVVAGLMVSPAPANDDAIIWSVLQYTCVPSGTKLSKGTSVPRKKTSVQTTSLQDEHTMTRYVRRDDDVVSCYNTIITLNLSHNQKPCDTRPLDSCP